jgi:hypothetical protein
LKLKHVQTQNDWSATVNVFEGNVRLSISSASSTINALLNVILLKQRTGEINDDSIMQLQHLLKNQTWASVEQRQLDQQ